MLKPDPIRPLGDVFPPRSPLEVALYCEDEIFRGYSEHAAGEEIPGTNSSAAYRWGALNRQRDRSGQDDGFDHIRREFLAAHNPRESSNA